MVRIGAAIGLLRSRHLPESSERSFSAGLVLTTFKVGGGVYRLELHVFSVLSLAVDSPFVLKSLLVAVLCSLWIAVSGIG